MEPYISYLKMAMANFKKRGYKVIVGKNVFSSKGIASSNTPWKRAKEIQDAFASDADLVLSVGGGELEVELLPYLDFDEIASRPPKWFMGFSDNTCLTIPLLLLTDTRTIYGPCATAYSKYPFYLDREDAFRMLEGKKSFKGYKKWEREGFDPFENEEGVLNLTEKKIIKAINYKEPFEGTLVGGCLDCLASICGSKYGDVKSFIDRNEGPFVWYLEACDLGPLSIRRALFQLDQAGWFEKASGFLIGRSHCLDKVELGLDAHQAYAGYLKEKGLPILLDIDLGHHDPSMPMQNGAFAKISLQKGNIFIDYQ